MNISNIWTVREKKTYKFIKKKGKKRAKKIGEK